MEGRGYTVVFMWECEYKNMRKTDEDLKEFLRTYNQQLNPNTKMTENEIIKDVKNETIFVVVECDIRVPDDKKELFSEMCPIFKNGDIPVEEIGEHMQQFVRKLRLR